MATKRTAAAKSPAPELVTPTGYRVKPEHLTNLQGRDFVLYAGLLDVAHQMGLNSIRTQIIQVPTEANGKACIVQATVTLKTPDGEESVFDGIGDASPRNVSRNIEPHLIRMAETRAKARALRDATNVSVAALEELDLEMGIQDALVAAQAPTSQASGSGGNTSSKNQKTAPVATLPSVAHAKDPISAAQMEESTRELKRTGWTTDQGRDYLTKHFSKAARAELTQMEAQTFIDHLKLQPTVEAAPDPKVEGVAPLGAQPVTPEQAEKLYQDAAGFWGLDRHDVLRILEESFGASGPLELTQANLRDLYADGGPLDRNRKTPAPAEDPDDVPV